MPLLSGSRSSLRVVVRLESVFMPMHKLVTRASYFRRRYARRSVLLKTNRQFSLVSSVRRRWFVCSGLRFLLVLPLASYALCTNAKVCSATLSRSLSSVIMW